MFAPGSASALDTFWQNAGTGSWLTGANWTLGVPTAGDNAIIDNGGTAEVDGAGAVALSVVIGDAGTGTVNLLGGNTLTVNGGAGAVTLGATGGSGILQFGTGGASGALSASGIAAGTGSGQVIFNHTGSLTMSAPITGNIALTKQGASGSTTTLTGNNTFTGGAHIDDGTLQLNQPFSNPFQGPIFVGDGLGAASSASLVLLAGSQIADAASVTVASDGLLFSFGENMGALTLNGGVADTGVVTGLAPFGTITSTAGTIQGTAPFFTSGNSVIINAAATSTTISAPVNLSGTTTFTVANGAAAVDLLVSNTLSNGSLIKAGAGTMVLSGANTYAGTTSVNGGRLVVNGSLAATATTVAAGASLEGDGSTAGSVTVASGGTLAPGDLGPGSLATGNLQLNAGATLQMDLGTPYGAATDQLQVTGTVTVSGATLNFTVGTFTPTLGDTVVLIDNDGADAVVGNFSGLAEGAKINLGGYAMRITYVGGDGNDVVLTAVPPTAAIPTLSELGMAMLTVLIGLAGAFRLSGAYRPAA